MKTLLFSSFVLLFLYGCNNTSNNYDGKALLKEKCSACHNLDLPANWKASKLAPPIMAVTFHVYDLVDKDIATKYYSSKKFISNYVLNPSLEKSLCDKNSLKEYGLMPSQKNNVTKEELDAITTYMLNFYTQENLLKIQKQNDYLKSLSKQQKLILKYNCNSCHKIDKKLVGPSFKTISKLRSLEEIKYGIKNGSKNNYKGIKASMPAFKNITEEEIDILSKWIKNIK